MRYVYDGADRPVCRLEEDRKHGICRSRVYRYADTCAFPWEELCPGEDRIKTQNAFLMHCEGLDGYISEEAGTLICREKPQQVLYYHGKKAGSIYSRLEEVYHDLSIPPGEKMPDYGEEGRDYLLAEYHYDFRGSLTGRRDMSGNLWSYGYDTEGRLIRESTPEGRETSYTYDGQGREQTRTNGEGETEYRLEHDALGRITAYTDGEGNRTCYTYHPCGKTATVTGPDGVTDYRAEHDVWGRPDSETDGDGNRTLYGKDLWGRVIKVSMPDGGVERYSYDFAGRVSRATDALGNETRFTYRGDGRPESIRRADGTVRRFGYDAEGRCSSRLDENGNLVRTVYNMDGNPVLVTGSRPGSEGPDIRSIYTYDGQGYLATASEGGTVYHYTRDREGRTLSRSAWGRTLYEDRYDRDGRLQGSADGMGKISYRYDRAGRLTRVSSDSGAGAGYRYDRNGRQTQVLYANGMKTSYRYDSRNRMTGMETVMPGGELLYRLSCTYDRAGNRDGREEQYRDAVSGSIHTAVTSYAYDSMGRLTGETLDGETACYSYDHAGNRLTRTGAGRTEHYRYNSRNQLTELDSTDGTVRYEYDPAGSLTAEVHTAQGGSAAERTGYTYDAYNRNISVCGAGYVQQNHYDAEGLRNAVTENGSTTNFVYRNGMLSSELDADRNPVRGYVYGNEYISQNNGSSFSYYLDDEQGSIRYLTGSDGSIRNHYRYSAFGESITAEETVPNRLKYNAQMADELTGLYYLRARYYNASLGRFTQEDVIYNDGLNLYAYCNSNPVMYSDPSGFAKETCKSKVGGECDSESGTPSGFYQDANGRWHRPNGDFASNAEVGIASPAKTATGSHGNSLSDPRTNYGYVLVDKDTNEILKFGETLYPETRYSKSYLEQNNAVMKVLESGSKEYIHYWQYDMNKYFEYMYDEFPPLLKSKGW